MSYLILESVGSVIDTKELIVYPLCKDGLPDTDAGVEVSELCEEWLESLSYEDDVEFRKVIGAEY